jgi:hypothetical protein
LGKGFDTLNFRRSKMNTKEPKDKRGKAGCCNSEGAPKDFKKMYEMMAKCWQGMGCEWGPMMKEMMKGMWGESEK